MPALIAEWSNGLPIYDLVGVFTVFFGFFFHLHLDSHTDDRRSSKSKWLTKTTPYNISSL